MNPIEEGARMSAADLKRYLRIIATALHASSWCVQRATMLIGEPLENWRWSLCEELSNMEQDDAAHGPGNSLDQLSTWRPELLFGALGDQFGTHVNSTYSYSSSMRDERSECETVCSGVCWPPAVVIEHGREHCLGWATMGDDSTCFCFAFMRPRSAGSFTEKDVSVLALLAEELLRPACMAEATVHACPQPELSPRQQDVLDRLLTGLTVKEVALDLRLSPHTVNDYVRALYKRFNVSSRGELMAVVHGRRKPQFQ